MTEEIAVPLSDLTPEQLARATFARLSRLETSMSELDDAVADLKTSVDAISSRLLTKIDTLQSQLADAVGGQADALADAQQNVAAIRGDIAELDAIGADQPAPPADSGGDTTPPADTGDGSTPPADDGSGTPAPDGSTPSA